MTTAGLRLLFSGRMNMDYTQTIMHYIEVLGIISFASSGAILGIRKHMDPFGVCVLGCVTALGGGIIRDVILGLTPPSMFKAPSYTIIAIVVSILLFVIVYMKRDMMKTTWGVLFDKAVAICDAAGLGIFTIVGIRTALEAGYTQRFLLLFVALVTGIGGGLIRDILAMSKPYVLTKHIYALACLAGAACYIIILPYVGDLTGTIISASLVIIIRLLAMHYRWNLPRVKGKIDI